NRISGFARHLVRMGHEVTVITGLPNYPVRKLYPGFRVRWCQIDQDGGVKLWRTWLTICYPKRPIHRLMNYLGFFFSSLSAAFFCAGRHDVIIATSGPILVGFSGVILSLFKRKPLVLDLRDMWPERVVAAGEFANPLAVKILEFVEKMMYWRASRIICVTQGLHDHLLEKEVPARKLAVITNSTDPVFFEQDVRGKVFEEFGIAENAFVAVYAGNFGIFQDLELILDAAQNLATHHEIRFLLVGEGVKRRSLEEETARRGLNNVHIGPNLDRHQLARVLKKSKVGLNANTCIAHNAMAIPVKMFDYMACGLPVVLANTGEVEKIVEESKAGFCVPQGSVESFSEAILKLYRDDRARCEMGQNGTRFVRKHFDARVLSDKLAGILSEVTSRT
ncbi:MAG: glycosyltransferase family 4 protein, partial [Candidatus Omnitrophica bacterium]|nr:glycosyltransferase family 4 protein [Candidatus Omnitrophota bacterium]